MREIKFRAWMKEKKLMTDYAKQLYNGALMTARWKDDSPSLILMQFTGLKDKNGREIYEGDIVKPAFSEFNHQVQWDAAGACWRFIHLGFEPPLNKSYAELFKVIGNIHEHPELLK